MDGIVIETGLDVNCRDKKVYVGESVNRVWDGTEW